MINMRGVGSFKLITYVGSFSSKSRRRREHDFVKRFENQWAWV